MSFSTIAAAAVTAVLTLATAATLEKPPLADQAIARRIVVAELFTSEGCSSCPPADALLQQIASQSPVGQVEVIGLEEHVDYWDRLGWRDPFSSATFTSRQSEYARVFRSGRIYTPQLVVDGAFEAVGSDRSAVRAAIAAAAARPAATVHVSAAAANDRAQIDVSVDMPPSLGRKGSADLLVAIVEDGLVSRVQRGENGGRTLPHSAVVRSLTTIATLPADATSRSVSRLLPWSQAWRTSRLRVVGFVQEHDSRRILGAAATSLATPSARAQ
jgi:hypothetical protein